MGANDYCSYELSLALKAVGFNVPCNYGYSVKMRLEPEVSFGEPKMVHSKDQKNYNDNRKGIEKGLSFLFCHYLMAGSEVAARSQRHCQRIAEYR